MHEIPSQKCGANIRRVFTLTNHFKKIFTSSVFGPWHRQPPDIPYVRNPAVVHP